jgi:purine-cytosine permease-like protein
VTAWLYVPVGILIILLACFGVNSLIGLSSVSFPASVALLVMLFFSLMICDWIVGDRKTRALVNVIDVPVCLRSISFWLCYSDYARLAGLFDI